MAKYIVTVEVDADDEWVAEGAPFIGRQVEKMVDDNAGGHATAYVADIRLGAIVEEETTCRYEVQLQSNGTPKCLVPKGTWFQTHPFTNDYASQADAEAAIAAYLPDGELAYLSTRVVMIQTVVAVAAANINCA